MPLTATTTAAAAAGRQGQQGQQGQQRRRAQSPAPSRPSRRRRCRRHRERGCAAAAGSGRSAARARRRWEGERRRGGVPGGRAGGLPRRPHPAGPPLPRGDEGVSAGAPGSGATDRPGKFAEEGGGCPCSGGAEAGPGWESEVPGASGASPADARPAPPAEGVCSQTRRFHGREIRQFSRSYPRTPPREVKWLKVGKN